MTQWPSPPPIKQAKIICIGSQLKFSFKHWCWYWPSIALFRMGASLEHIGREFALKLWFWLPQRQSFHSCAFLSCVCVCNLFVPSGLTICCSSSRFNFGLMFFHPWERPVITTKRCMKSAHAHTITTHTRKRARTPLTTPGWCIIIVLFPACFALFIARFRPHPPRQHYGNYMIDRPIVNCAWSFWVYCLSSRWPSLWHHRRLTVSLQSVLSACDHNSVWMALHPAAKCPPHTEIDTQLREEERVIKRTLVHILP